MAYFEPTLALHTPKIIACNHPNSFFDAINIAVHYPKPIYFLARGDAFKKPLIASFLKSLHLIPIYRLSEGKENLCKNAETFERCAALLKQNQTILIFPEGVCINEWNLRPLKKGTARLALLALQEGITNLQILPANINYSSFSKKPKDIIIHFNSEFRPNDLLQNKEIHFYNAFNTILKEGISNKMAFKNDLNEMAINTPSILKMFHRIVFAIPALIGFILNYPIYITLKKITIKKTEGSVFYDSVLFGLLLLLYPIFVLLLACIVGTILNIKIGLILFLTMPFSAWCYKFYKSL